MTEAVVVVATKESQNGICDYLFLENYKTGEN